MQSPSHGLPDIRSSSVSPDTASSGSISQRSSLDLACMIVHVPCWQRTKHIFKISFPVNKKLFRIPRFTDSQMQWVAQQSALDEFSRNSACGIVVDDAHFLELLYSRFLWWVKTFANFAILWCFAKVLSTKPNLESVLDSATSGTSHLTHAMCENRLYQ